MTNKFKPVVDVKKDNPNPEKAFHNHCDLIYDDKNVVHCSDDQKDFLTIYGYVNDPATGQRFEFELEPDPRVQELSSHAHAGYRGKALSALGSVDVANLEQDLAIILVEATQEALNCETCQKTGKPGAGFDTSQTCIEMQSVLQEQRVRVRPLRSDHEMLVAKTTNATSKYLDELQEEPAFAEVIENFQGLKIPTRRTAIALCELFEFIAFDGLRSEKDFNPHGVLESFVDELAADLIHTNNCDSQKSSLSIEDAKARALELIEKSASSFKTIREKVAEDVMFAYTSDPAAVSLAMVAMIYPGPWAIAMYRFGHELQRLGLSLIPRLISEFAKERTGIEIHPSAKIGRFFHIDHGTGVVIGATTILGEENILYAGVTLGAKSVSPDESKTQRHPRAGNKNIFYAGATVLGVRIGNGCVIGANVFLIQTKKFGHVSDNQQVIWKDGKPEFIPIEK